MLTAIRGNFLTMSAVSTIVHIAVSRICGRGTYQSVGQPALSVRATHNRPQCNMRTRRTVRQTLVSIAREERMKRYDIFYPVPQCSARMEENGDGDYVLWDDVKHLVAPAQQATNSAMVPCDASWEPGGKCFVRDDWRCGVNPCMLSRHQ